MRLPWARLVKALHSLVLLAMLAAIGYVFYGAFSGRLDRWLWLAVAVVVLEGAVYLAFGRRCPLTLWARHLGDESGHDLLGEWLLPEAWLRWVVPAGATLFVVALLLLALLRLGG